ncbi:sugar nucleotide-binding protein [Colwellia sp. RE-S-Sl-9]
MNNILIIGGDGFIASACQTALPNAEVNVYTTSRKQKGGNWYFDLANIDSMDFLIENIKIKDINTVIFCAGMTSNAACIKQPHFSTLVNVNHTVLLLSKLNALGVFSIFLSSSQVFNHQTPFIEWQSDYSATTLYGQQKVQVETFITENKLNTAILRLTKVVGKGYALFDGIVDKAKTQQNIILFDDYCAAPISLNYVVDTLIAICEEKKSGIYQLSGAEDLSYAKMAELLLSYLDLKAEIIKISATSKGITPVLFGSLNAISSSELKLNNQSFTELLSAVYGKGN